MKIAFWSNCNEKCNVSANLAAISVASVLRYPYSVVMMENRLSNSLRRAFLGTNRENFLCEVGTNYYDGGGMEGLLRKIYRGNYHPDILKTHLKEIINQHLFYIPQSKVIHSEVFDYEFDHCIYQLFHMIEDNVDICLIDTASHNILSTKTILEEADLIVVNLYQHQSILDDFFHNYSSMIPKAVFIISNYDIHSRLNSRWISSKYEIPKENIILLPNNISYQSAYLNGSVVAFIYKNYFCIKENPNYIFIQSIKKAAYVIIKKTEQMVKQKEISMCCK